MRATPGNFAAPPNGPDHHVFCLEIPPRSGDVMVSEFYGYEGLSMERAIIKRPLWSQLAEPAQDYMNRRIKEAKERPTSPAPESLAPGRWMVGRNRIDRLLGKELCVLLWAAEQAAGVEELNAVIRAWCALRPEEAWWFFNRMDGFKAAGPGDSRRPIRRGLYLLLTDKEHNR